MTTFIFISIAALILIMVAAKPKKEPPVVNHTYQATFGNETDYLSRHNHGFAVTGTRALTRDLSHTNTALFGPTGSGKSSSVIFRSAISLARKKSSIIFFDVSGEIRDHTAHYLANKGYSILVVDWTDPEHSESFNCLTHCNSVSDIQKMAQLLLKNANGETKGDIFWEQSSMMLISLFARYLKFYEEPQYCNLQNVLRLIEKFAVDKTQTIDKMIIRTKDEDLLSSYKATLAMSDRTLQSVISSVRASMVLFTDPSVCQTTATNTIDFQMLRERPVALYCCTPLKDLTYFRPLSALFFQTLFNFILSRIPEKRDRSIFTILDEFATMRFSACSTLISNVRKFQAGVLICMQDEQALISQYGAAEGHQIKTNCGTQIYLKGQPLKTCTELSQLLGRYTYVDDKGIQRTREMMTPDEIRMSEKGIILINNQPPLKCDIVPYHQSLLSSIHLRHRPYTPQSKHVIDPPLIPFT